MNSRMNITIDSNLVAIIKMHCKCNNITMSHFIAESVADNLNLQLNSKHGVDDSYYIPLKIKEIDKRIDGLNSKKKELEDMIK